MAKLIQPFNPKPTIVPTEDLRSKIQSKERSFGTYGPTTSSYGAKLNPDLTERLSVIEESIGRPLTIKSGFRDPDYNAKVGGANGSQHIHGNAVDLDTGDWSRADKLALIEKASAAGITGIGVYDNNLHFDVVRAVPGGRVTVERACPTGRRRPLPSMRPTGLPACRCPPQCAGRFRRISSMPSR